MLITRVFAGMFSVGMLFSASGVFSQDVYPSKPVRIYTAPIGGSTDRLSRILADPMAATLGQTVIVENRPVIPGTEIVAKAAPDGYSLVLGSGSLWIGPVMQKLPYEAVRDLAPVSMIAKQSMLLMAHPSLPVRSVKDLIALAKARPGALNYTTGSPGSASHLASILFKSMANVDMQHIPEGSIQADIAVISGEIELLFGSLGSSMSIIKSGKVRVLAVSSTERSQLAPQFPTMAESGLPGAEASTTNAVFAPVRTPPAIIHRLNQEIVRAVNSAKVQQQMLSAGIEPASSTPEQLAAVVKADIATVSQMIKDGAIKTTK